MIVTSEGVEEREYLVCCCLPTPEIAAVQELFDDLPEDGTPETVLAFVALIPDALEFVEMILDQVIQRGILGVARPIDSLRMTFHIGSNRLPDSCANLMF